MTYTIENKIVDYGTAKISNVKYVIAHSTANPDAGIDNEVAYMKRNWQNAFVSHFVGGGGRIIQIAKTGYIQWGVGPKGNPYSYAQVELCETTDEAEFKKDYAAYIWLLRQLAKEAELPVQADTGTKGVMTHKWVTDNLGSTDHVDPYTYLAKWGISKAQFQKDILNGLETDTPVAVVVGATATAATTGIIKKYAEAGTFYPNDTIIVRDQPSTKGTIIARYYKGEKVTYHTVHVGNGYVWLQYNRSNGKQGYIPCREYKDGKYGTLWGTIK